jgi:hypothetical protein
VDGDHPRRTHAGGLRRPQDGFRRAGDARGRCPEPVVGAAARLFADSALIVQNGSRPSGPHGRRALERGPPRRTDHAARAAAGRGVAQFS